MKKITLLFLAALFLVACSGAKNDSPQMTGKFTWDEWRARTGWPNAEQIGYKPDPADYSTLAAVPEYGDYRFVVFGSTHCDECREELPKLFADLRLADERGYVTLYGLDEDLTEPTGFYENYDIPTTPTLFVMKNGRQIGMITYPDFDWLGGVLKIVEKDLEESD